MENGGERPLEYEGNYNEYTNTEVWTISEYSVDRVYGQVNNCLRLENKRVWTMRWGRIA